MILEFKKSILGVGFLGKEQKRFKLLPPSRLHLKYLVNLKTDKSTGQSSVQIGVSAGCKLGAGVITDNNAEFKFRVPVEKKKP